MAHDNGDTRTADKPKDNRASTADAVEALMPSDAADGIKSLGVGLRRAIRRSFDDQQVEELYQSYASQCKSTDIDCFFLAGCLVAVHAAVSLSLDSERQAAGGQQLIGAGLFSLSAVTAASLGFYVRRKEADGTEQQNKRQQQQHHLLIYAGWLLTSGLILAQLGFHLPVQWVLMEVVVVCNFLACVTLPFRLRQCLILSFAVSFLFLTHSIWHHYGNESGNNFGSDGEHHRTPAHQQVLGEVILLLGSISLGVVAYLVADVRQRKAFLDTRQSFEMRRSIEDQAKEQEQLLLSVLPEHVAVKMRQDLGTAHDGQFKKIYMSRHENVSILFADIVGFTAISSTYPASELVHILNELFARFDRLSQRYHQMRIKILGDCYYCICGAPVERPDHAVLCVYMGLAMIDAIKCVRESTSSPVDMRVGIHTGAVLAGVLGQRQWQFDVYSQDVELANKMESSGQPGRVHVSSRTLSFLGDQFEVEPAHGEKREQVLRTAGLETYFILRARHPPAGQPAEETDSANKVRIVNKTDTVITLDSASESSGCFKCCRPSTRSATAMAATVTVGENHALLTVQTNADGRPSSDSQELQQAVVGVGAAAGSNQLNVLTQTFRDSEREAKYRQHRDPTAVYNLLGLPMALIWLALYILITAPWNPIFIVFLPVAALLLFLFAVSVADTWHWRAAILVSKFSARVNERLGLRCFVVVLGILLLVSAHLVGQGFNRSFPCPGEAAVVLISVAMVPHLASCFKGTLLVLLSSAYICLPVLHYKPTLTIPCWRSYWLYSEDLYMLELILASCALLVVALALFSLSRQLESTSRALFTNWASIEEQREKAADLGRRNQALLFNILPAHVAHHFLRKDVHQRDEQLYSKSCTSVGVLFASIPNFSEFYSEESVNNQGLECLRFLNEVISDFDALLDQAQFSELTKIKTIGSTYMAASGLNVINQLKEEDDVQTRWKHLAQLLEFALSMQRTLQSINDQSFNHFVLRMGINHGPLTAGVIGATKPHYDIWGNAVNVASRMESTGKAGCIQVTEETSAILRQFGYKFEQRGLVFVKGKGQLLTYYLIDSDVAT